MQLLRELHRPDILQTDVYSGMSKPRQTRQFAVAHHLKKQGNN
jgi:hypothetical protein